MVAGSRNGNAQCCLVAALSVRLGAGFVETIKLYALFIACCARDKNLRQYFVHHFWAGLVCHLANDGESLRQGLLNGASVIS